MMRPSGEMYAYNAIAVGKYRQGARTELEKVNSNTIRCAEAVELIAMILYKLHDDVRDKPFELELLWQTEATGYKVAFVPNETRDNAVAAAKAAKERALMADSDDEEE